MAKERSEMCPTKVLKSYISPKILGIPLKLYYAFDGDNSHQPKNSNL